MKKFLILLSLICLCVNPSFAANEWRNGDSSDIPAGSTEINNTPDVINDYLVDPLERLVGNYQSRAHLIYTSESTITIHAGEVVCSDSDGDVTAFRSNSSTTLLSWSDIDDGAEAASTTYYVYANCDADATTFTGKISVNSSEPTGVTNYRRIGSFYNNLSSNIEQVTNDDARMEIQTGSVADGGTIPLISGYSEDECDWQIGGNTTLITDGNGETYTTTNIAYSGRVVACTSTASDTCSTYYMIICHR